MLFVRTVDLACCKRGEAGLLVKLNRTQGEKWGTVELTDDGVQIGKRVEGVHEGEIKLIFMIRSREGHKKVKGRS